MVLVTLVAVGAVAGAAAAAANGSVSASPATPGETATHTITVTVGSSTTGSLNGLAIDYSGTGTDISNVGVENVRTVGIDRGDDTDGDSIDQDVSDDMESAQGSNDGETLTLQFGGSHDLNEGDEIVVVVEEVQNPEAGDYTVDLDINPQSTGGEASATLSIGDTASGSTATDSDSAGDTNTDSAGSDGGSEVSGPGFGAGLTVLALLGGAFVATRRRN
ncbi:MAG: PGF-CTERM sorting domain-containing protein [Halolamina sp.]